MMSVISGSAQDAADMMQQKGEDCILDMTEAAQEKLEEELSKAAEAQLEHAAKQAQQIGNQAIAATKDGQAMVAQLKADLKAKRRSMSTACQAKVDTLTKGLEAQAQMMDVNPQAAAAFFEIYGAMVSVAEAEAGSIKDQLLETEKNLRANVANAVLKQFVSAELRVPTAYEAKSLLHTAKLVCTMNPSHIKRDTIETERLMEKLDELCGHDVSIETWGEIFDGWMVLYKFHGKAKGERNRSTIEQIFNDPIAMAAFGRAKQLRHLNQSSAYLEQMYEKSFKPPPELLHGISETKIIVKNSIDKYKRVADKEILKMGKIAHLQQQVVAFFAIIIGNFISLAIGYFSGLTNRETNQATQS